MHAARWSRTPAAARSSGIDLAARLDRDRAARMEPAAGRKLDRVGRLAAQDLNRGPMPRVPARHDREQRLRVRMPRTLDDLASGSFLDDAAEVHHADAIGEARGRREVVSDHEHRETLIAELVEDPENSGPDRDVEHRDGLVRHEQVRPEDEARGDRDTLPLAPRELVREPVREELGRARGPPARARGRPPRAARSAIRSRG